MLPQKPPAPGLVDHGHGCKTRGVSTVEDLTGTSDAGGRAPELPQFRDSHLITLLRNFHEHWDDQEGPSARSLRDVRPNHVTESARLLDGNLWMHGIRSEDLHAWLSAVDDAARAALTAPWDEMPAPSDPLPA